jgi:hypothetical protein
MINTKTGGPAFPRAGNEWADMAWVEAPAKDGMTMRDYFAAKAMQGMFDYWHENPNLEFEHIASCSYDMADAMMAARSKP